jgi:hypothetical protein
MQASANGTVSSSPSVLSRFSQAAMKACCFAGSSLRGSARLEEAASGKLGDDEPANNVPDVRHIADAVGVEHRNHVAHRAE